MVFTLSHIKEASQKRKLENSPFKIGGVMRAASALRWRRSRRNVSDFDVLSQSERKGSQKDRASLIGDQGMGNGGGAGIFMGAAIETLLFTGLSRRTEFKSRRSLVLAFGGAHSKVLVPQLLVGWMEFGLVSAIKVL